MKPSALMRPVLLFLLKWTKANSQDLRKSTSLSRICTRAWSKEGGNAV